MKKKYCIVLPNVEKPLQYQEIEANNILQTESGQTIFYSKSGTIICVAPPQAFVKKLT